MHLPPTHPSPDQVRQILFSEMGRVLPKWFKEANVDTRWMCRERRKPRIHSLSRATMRWRPFPLPEWIQECGGRGAVRAGIYSRHMDKVVGGLHAIVADIQRQLDEFKALVKAGSVKSELKNKNAQEIDNGITFDNYQGMERRMKLVNDMLHLLTRDRSDTTWTRICRA